MPFLGLHAASTTRTRNVIVENGRECGPDWEHHLVLPACIHRDQQHAFRAGGKLAVVCATKREESRSRDVSHPERSSIFLHVHWRKSCSAEMGGADFSVAYRFKASRGCVGLTPDEPYDTLRYWGVHALGRALRRLLRLKFQSYGAVSRAKLQAIKVENCGGANCTWEL